jgi:hypothetical protein
MPGGEGTRRSATLGEMAALMAKLAPALERHAADLRGGGKPGKLVDTSIRCRRARNS